MKNTKVKQHAQVGAEGSRYVERVCKNHGTSVFILERRGSYRCRQCRVDAVTKRRCKVKRLLVEAHGGQCIKCGYNKSPKAMDFHHKDPTTKSFSIARAGVTISYDRLFAESLKCELLCANCHRELDDINLVGDQCSD